MPHLTLEFSKNVLEKEFKPFLTKAHNLLSEGLPTKLSSCCSKIICHENYLIGDGKDDNAFVHLSIGIKKGRAPELIESLAKLILDLLKQHLTESKLKLKLKISLEIYEISPYYFQGDE